MNRHQTSDARHQLDSRRKTQDFTDAFSTPSLESRVLSPESRVPVKVVFVIWSLGLGGAEQVVIRLATGLDRRRFTPRVCCLNNAGSFAEAVRQQGIEVVALNKRPGVDLIMLWRLTRLMRQQHIEVVHAHLWGANFWGRLAARLAGVPIMIAHEHGLQPWRGGFHFFCDRLLANCTTRVLFASRQVMTEYQRRSGIASSKCLVVPNGVTLAPPVRDRRMLRQQRGWSDADRIIMSVGRLSPEKGYEDLLNAFARILPQVPQARLVIVGDGEQRRDLQLLQRRAGLNGHVTWTGQQHDVTSWLSAADVYVQPSRREGLPLAVLEAMVAGLPVIATQVGDLPYLMTHGQQGYLVPAQHPATLASAIVDVLHHLDRQRPVIEAAKQMVRQRYGIEQMVRTIESVYDEALAAHRRETS